MKIKTVMMRILAITIAIVVFMVLVISVGEKIGDKFEVIKNKEAEAQTIKRYKIEILGKIERVRPFLFTIEATEFFETWESTYYKFTLVDGTIQYYPKARVIVTVKQ